MSKIEHVAISWVVIKIYLLTYILIATKCNRQNDADCHCVQKHICLNLKEAEKKTHRQPDTFQQPSS